MCPNHRRRIENNRLVFIVMNALLIVVHHTISFLERYYLFKGNSKVITFFLITFSYKTGAFSEKERDFVSCSLCQSISVVLDYNSTIIVGKLDHFFGD